MKIKLLDLLINPFSMLNTKSKQTVNQNRYKQLLVHISDGLHNYQDITFFSQNNIDKKIYEETIRDFFNYLRFVQLDEDLCSEKKYQQILQFIKNDYYNYFSGKSSAIDIDKFKNICEGK